MDLDLENDLLLFNSTGGAEFNPGDIAYGGVDFDFASLLGVPADASVSSSINQPECSSSQIENLEKQLRDARTETLQLHIKYTREKLKTRNKHREEVKRGEELRLLLAAKEKALQDKEHEVVDLNLRKEQEVAALKLRAAKLQLELETERSRTIDAKIIMNSVDKLPTKPKPGVKSQDKNDLLVKRYLGYLIDLSRTLLKLGALPQFYHPLLPKWEKMKFGSARSASRREGSVSLVSSSLDEEDSEDSDSDMESVQESPICREQPAPALAPMVTSSAPVVNCAPPPPKPPESRHPVADEGPSDVSMPALFGTCEPPTTMLGEEVEDTSSDGEEVSKAALLLEKNLTELSSYPRGSMHHYQPLTPIASPLDVGVGLEGPSLSLLAAPSGVDQALGEYQVLTPESKISSPSLSEYSCSSEPHQQQETEPSVSPSTDIVCELPVDLQQPEEPTLPPPTPCVVLNITLPAPCTVPNITLPAPCEVPNITLAADTPCMVPHLTLAVDTPCTVPHLTPTTPSEVGELAPADPPCKVPDLTPLAGKSRKKRSRITPPTTRTSSKVQRLHGAAEEDGCEGSLLEEQLVEVGPTERAEAIQEPSDTADRDLGAGKDAALALEEQELARIFDCMMFSVPAMVSPILSPVKETFSSAIPPRPTRLQARRSSEQKTPSELCTQDATPLLPCGQAAGSRDTPSEDVFLPPPPRHAAKRATVPSPCAQEPPTPLPQLPRLTRLGVKQHQVPEDPPRPRLTKYRPPNEPSVCPPDVAGLRPDPAPCYPKLCSAGQPPVNPPAPKLTRPASVPHSLPRGGLYGVLLGLKQESPSVQRPTILSRVDYLPTRVQSKTRVVTTRIEKLPMSPVVVDREQITPASPTVPSISRPPGGDTTLATVSAAHLRRPPSLRQGPVVPTPSPADPGTPHPVAATQPSQVVVKKERVSLSKLQPPRVSAELSPSPVSPGLTPPRAQLPSSASMLPSSADHTPPLTKLTTPASFPIPLSSSNLTPPLTKLPTPTSFPIPSSSTIHTPPLTKLPTPASFPFPPSSSNLTPPLTKLPTPTSFPISTNQGPLTKLPTPTSFPMPPSSSNLTPPLNKLPTPTNFCIPPSSTIHTPPLTKLPTPTSVPIPPTSTNQLTKLPTPTGIPKLGDSKIPPAGRVTANKGKAKKQENLKARQKSIFGDSDSEPDEPGLVERIAELVDKCWVPMAQIHFPPLAVSKLCAAARAQDPAAHLALLAGSVCALVEQRHAEPLEPWLSGLGLARSQFRCLALLKQLESIQPGAGVSMQLFRNIGTRVLSATSSLEVSALCALVRLLVAVFRVQNRFQAARSFLYDCIYCLASEYRAAATLGVLGTWPELLEFPKSGTQRKPHQDDALVLPLSISYVLLACEPRGTGEAEYHRVLMHLCEHKYALRKDMAGGLLQDVLERIRELLRSGQFEHAARSSALLAKVMGAGWSKKHLLFDVCWHLIRTCKDARQSSMGPVQAVRLLGVLGKLIRDPEMLEHSIETIVRHILATRAVSALMQETCVLTLLSLGSCSATCARVDEALRGVQPSLQLSKEALRRVAEWRVAKSRLTPPLPSELPPAPPPPPPN